MASRTDSGVLYQRVMEETGFYRNGVPTSGVIEAESLRNDNQQLERRLKYSAVIDPEQINATAVFELSGSPCIYFTQLDSDPDPKELARLHKLSWNHGLAPMLWVVTPTQVRLYNCYAKPTQDDPDSKENSILIDLFENTEASLKQLREHANRLQFETGEFWKWQNARQIDRKKRVDRVLVEDLRATEKLLRERGLEPEVAHALLMKSIFVAYLEDRGILTSQFFESHFRFDSFVSLLDDISATHRLFEWLKYTFNGDMFSISSDDSGNSYESNHLEIVKDLVCGKVEVETGQGRLWREYDFKIIPVELISSIYENFLHSKDAKSAKERSVHYTPINLVDLVLDEVFKGLNGNAKILDLSCGSGVFLVESLRRLVVKRWLNGEEKSRKIVRDTLYNQIFGVDVEPQAIQIAAFSLYLTALELDYELDQGASISDDLKFRELVDRNLFSKNAFDESANFNFVSPFADKTFDAIVGNPPWTQSKTNQLAKDYCNRSRPEEGYPNGYPVARSDNPDQAFVWRIGDFSNKNTKIGLLLHAKPFFSQTPKARRAKEAILKRFRPLVIVNLAKLREEWIFPGSRAPTLMLVAECCPIEPADSCYLVCPDRLFDFNHHGIIEISSENIKRLPAHAIATDYDMLKVASWAGPRDSFLIQKLRNNFSVIKEVVGKPLLNGFKKGVGKQVPETLLLKKWVSSGEMSKYQVDLNRLGLLLYTQMEAPRNEDIYKPPLVIVSQAPDTTGVYSAFSEEMTVYTQKFSGVSVAQTETNLAHYLNGVINSSVTSYFLFLTASSWGVERDEVTLQDLSCIPIPALSSENEELISEVVAAEKQLRISKLGEKDSLKTRLNEAVFDLYGLEPVERVLVEDVVNLTINLCMSREKSVALERPTVNELKLYSHQLIGEIQPFLQTLRERRLTSNIIRIDDSPLQIVQFSFVSATDHKPIVDITKAQELREILRRIAEQLPQKIADQIYTRRDLRIYSGQDIFIVKPAQKRYWSRSAGLNDADLILSEHLRVNCAAIR
jgi:hypothetical protein